MTWLHEHIFNNTQLHTKDNVHRPLIHVQFDDFNQLVDIKCDEKVKFDTENLLLNAERKILIENYLNLNQLLPHINFVLAPKDVPNILVRNIKGFDQTLQNHHKYTNFLVTNYEMYFTSVNFEFYLNNTQITGDTCRYENFQSKSLNYFWPMTKIFLIYEISYTSPICPYVFINSQLLMMGLYEVTNSFIYKNRLEFINVDDEILSLNHTNLNGPAYLLINIVFEALTTKILCPHVFKNLQYLTIIGAPSSLQTNLFGSFKKIEHLMLNMDNLKSFFQRGLQWMSYLNEDLNLTKVNFDSFRQNSNRVVIVEISELNARYLTKAYTYPDEDICLFEHFPHQQLVIPSFNFLTEFQCTCTLIWLIQNYKFFNFQYVSNDMKIINNFEFFIKDRNVSQCLNTANYSLIFD